MLGLLFLMLGLASLLRIDVITPCLLTRKTVKGYYGKSA